MSILIRGIEMPKDCESCPCNTADAFGGLGCRATGYIPLRKANQNRPDNCPLVPVPPHGDLIDRDALMKDGWLNLHKEVMRMGGYAVHELPLANLSIPVVIPAEGVEGE